MIDGDTMQKILNDIRTMTSSDASSLDYDEEMLEWRRETETEYAEYLRGHPDAELHIPAELPPAGKDAES